MKRFLTFYLALLSSSILFAQAPTIEGTYLPVKGTRILQVYDTTAVNLFLPTTGPNQYWDYSNGFVNLTDSFSLATMDPDSNDYGYLFPDATHSAFLTLPWNSFGDSLYMFFVIDTSGLHNIGAYSIKTGFDTSFYSDPAEFVMQFNVTYGTVLIDTSKSVGYMSYAGLSLKVIQHKYKRMEGVGYGTLDGPLGVMNNVLLGRETIHNVDSFFVDALGNGNYVYNALIAPYGANPSTSIFDKWHFLRNNTFATTHLMLLQTTDTISNNIAYGWYTLPVDFGSIMGTVYDTTGIPITDGEILLYREYSNFTKNDILSTVTVDVNGQYQFDSIPFGEYRIAARPNLTLYPNAITTYYGDTTNWITCPTVITTSDSTFGIDINILYHPVVTGTANVNGNVQLDLSANKMDRTPRAGDPIPGIDISLEQVPGGIIANQGSTDTTGNFTMTDLEDGDYELFVDIPGLYMAGTYAFTIADGDIVTELNFVVGMDSIFPTSTPNISSISLIDQTTNNSLRVYPNPFTDNLTIMVDAELGEQVTLIVYDATGRMIDSKQFSTNKGVNRLNWNTSNVTQGIYLISIQSDRRALGSYKIVKR
ncbi:MAG: T9SS type A sorting domain-containing protein [Flavobacteriales bacterium]|nr:T9SS type A sorting domain-containing protein [Flavobacteriales bacterium]